LFDIHAYLHDAMLAQYMLGSYVLHSLMFCHKGWTDWAGFRHRGCPRLILHHVL